MNEGRTCVTPTVANNPTSAEPIFMPSEITSSPALETWAKRRKQEILMKAM